MQTDLFPRNAAASDTVAGDDRRTLDNRGQPAFGRRQTIFSRAVALARLTERSMPEPNSGCWLWTERVDPKGGYGEIRLGRKKWRAHRLSWAVHFGAAPDSLMVCHKCDVPSCINPAHLFLGTARDNMVDMARKGRWKNGSAWMRGERASRRKLSSEVVREIRSSRHTNRFWADALGLNIRSIQKVRRYESWTHL